MEYDIKKILLSLSRVDNLIDDDEHPDFCHEFNMTVIEKIGNLKTRTNDQLIIEKIERLKELATVRMNATDFDNWKLNDVHELVDDIRELLLSLNYDDNLINDDEHLNFYHQILIEI